MVIPVFFVIHWYASFFLHSLFHHRYAAHNHVTMPKKSERVFFLCCFFVHGSSYMSPYVYGIMHRLHHLHADTTEDPHSPQNEPNFFKLMLITRNNYQKYYTSKIFVEDNLKKNLPQWNSFEKIVHNWVARSIWVVVYITLYVAFATSTWTYLLLPLTITMAAFQGNIINWMAHRIGYENYAMKNSSKNICWIDIFFIGEAYHNNHHKYPGKIKNAHRWFETDLVYLVMNVMHKVGILRWKNS